MNLLYYSTVTDGAGEQLQKVVEALVPGRKIETYRTIHSLARRLRQPKHDLAMAILLATSKEELQEFLSIRDLLEDIRIILVLPDGGEDTVASGHTLRPRFLTYCDSDFSDVEAVASKMLRYTPPDKWSGNRSCEAMLQKREI